MREPQDPHLTTISGLLWAKNGFDDPNPDLVGLLLRAYLFEGIPDLEQMPYGESSGCGSHRQQPKDQWLAV